MAASITKRGTMPDSRRKIIHVDMDAFYASVEQRDFPEYRGKPIVVAGSPEGRGVVAAASYEARKYGIRSAMSSFKALKLCPHLIFVRHRFDVYQSVSHQIRAIFARYTDLIEPLSLDEAYLDVTRNKKDNPSATWIAREIKESIHAETGLTASAGISYNKFLAKIASEVNKPDGLYLIKPEQAEAFIENLAIEKFYGIGKVTATRMNSLGIHTGADLKKLSAQELLDYFGRSGLYYYEIARGIDDREVEPNRIRKSIGAENTFHQDLLQREHLYVELDKLALEVMDWMTSHQVYGRTLTVKVKYGDFHQITRSKTLLDPILEEEALIQLARNLLNTTEAGHRPVRLVGISVSNLGERPETSPVRQLTLNFG